MMINCYLAKVSSSATELVLANEKDLHLAFEFTELSFTRRQHPSVCRRHAPLSPPSLPLSSYVAPSLSLPFHSHVFITRPLLFSPLQSPSLSPFMSSLPLFLLPPFHPTPFSSSRHFSLPACLPARRLPPFLPSSLSALQYLCQPSAE